MVHRDGRAEVDPVPVATTQGCDRRPQWNDGQGAGVASVQIYAGIGDRVAEEELVSRLLRNDVDVVGYRRDAEAVVKIAERARVSPVSRPRSSYVKVTTDVVVGCVV